MYISMRLLGRLVVFFFLILGHSSRVHLKTVCYVGCFLGPLKGCGTECRSEKFLLFNLACGTNLRDIKPIWKFQCTKKEYVR